jgi:hypothetical protein
MSGNLRRPPLSLPLSVPWCTFFQKKKKKEEEKGKTTQL